MIEGDFMKVTVLGSLPGASNPVVNVWDFKCLYASDPNALQNVGPYIVDAFIARYYAPLLAQISSYYSLYSVQLRVYGDPAEGYDATGLTITGGAAGAMCPPFVTYSVQITRDNFIMRNGRKAYPGVPTSVVQNAGLPTAAVVSAFNTAFAGWEDTDFSVEAGEADFTFQDVIVRKPSTPNAVPTVYSGVSGYSFNGFGTQNSRKA